MRIKLSDNFTYNKIIRFVLPSVAMMVFTSIYYVVDGFFVSNFVGKTSFAAVNLIMPYLMVLSTVGFMFGTGGSAIVGKTLGEKKPDEANQYFSMLVYVCIISGLILTVLGIVLLKPVAIFFGASGQLLDDCMLYGIINMASVLTYMLQTMFQSFFIVAEKPRLGFIVTVAAGVANMVFDFFFIALFSWGIAGAALATVLSESIGGIIPIIYFARKNDSLLRLTRTKFYGKVLLKTCTNGCSEMANNIAGSFVSMLFNFQLMRLAGSDGVAAYGVIMYVNFIFIAIFFGYSMGIAPVVSYHYGARNTDELRSLLSKSTRLMFGAGALLTAIALALAVPLCKVFVGYDDGLYELTRHGYIIMAFGFILMGFNVFGSDFFTALNNGLVSAIIAIFRAIVFKSGAVIILPIFLGINGVWTSSLVAEVMATVLTVFFLLRNRQKYNYM